MLDDITLESVGTGRQALSSKRRKRKDIREMIEDQEMNVETRGETYVYTSSVDLLRAKDAILTLFFIFS
jgi:hypothetical protein